VGIICHLDYTGRDEHHQAEVGERPESIFNHIQKMGKIGRLFTTILEGNDPRISAASPPTQMMVASK
jgi:hypothetical protein